MDQPSAGNKNEGKLHSIKPIILCACKHTENSW